MVRKLKYHERKLLKKVDFINWDQNLKELAIIKQYGVTRDEYTRYNKLVRFIRQIAEKISALPIDDFRNSMSGLLIDKLYSLGLIKTKRLKKCAKLDVKAFCRRRLPVFIIQSGMLNEAKVDVATKYVQHGHVRVGPNVVRDPAFVVTREQEDFITWTEKFKRKIAEYNGEVDDYED